MTEQKYIAVTDTTLRDGDHAVSHQFTVSQVRGIAAALDAVGVPVLEVTHGDGLGGSSIQYGFSREKEEDYLSAAAEVIQRGRMAVLLVPGIGTRNELKRAASLGARVVRVCDALHRGGHLRAAHQDGQRPRHGRALLPDDGAHAGPRAFG